GLAADVVHRHPENDRQGEPAVHQKTAELTLCRICGIAVHRMEIHGHQRELDIVGLGNRAAGPMLVNVTDYEILEVAPVGRAIALLSNLLSLQGHSGFSTLSVQNTILYARPFCLSTRRGVSCKPGAANWRMSGRPKHPIFPCLSGARRPQRSIALNA